MSRVKEIVTEEAITRVLLTPLGSRVMRPHFGSRLFKLIDRPFNTEYKVDAIAYTYEAIEQNLKNIKIKAVEIVKNVIKLRVEDSKGELDVAVTFN